MTSTISTDRLDQIVTEIKAEMRLLSIDGVLPGAALDNFVGIDHYIDRNELGGLCDEERNADVDIDGVAYIQDKVDAWMRAGWPTDMPQSVTRRFVVVFTHPQHDAREITVWAADERTARRDAVGHHEAVLPFPGATEVDHFGYTLASVTEI